MPYRAAIIQALDSLQDCRVAGSSLASVRRHVQASLAEDDDDDDGNGNGNGGNSKSFRDSAFLTALKAAVDRGELMKVGGGDHYRLSDELVRRREGALREKTERLREMQRQKDLQARHHGEGKIKVAVATGSPNGVKEPPKHGRPEKAKKKLSERGGVVTILVEGKGRRGSDKMEVEREEGDAPAPGGTNKAAAEGKVVEYKESPHRKTSLIKTKITPHRVLKRAVKDPMETI